MANNGRLLRFGRCNVAAGWDRARFDKRPHVLSTPVFSSLPEYADDIPNKISLFPDQFTDGMTVPPKFNLLLWLD